MIKRFLVIILLALVLLTGCSIDTQDTRPLEETQNPSLATESTKEAVDLDVQLTY